MKTASIPLKPKGAATRAAIVDTALKLAAQMGLEGLSIGVLADSLNMSKSGVFAHFGSREELQISVVREYHHRFEQEVFYPALQAPAGLPRLWQLTQRWMLRTSHEIDSGCIYIGGAVEFDDQPGLVRDALVDSVNTWLNAVRRAIALSVHVGHLQTETDADQLCFEIHGTILALHYDARFLRLSGAFDRAFQTLHTMLQRHATPQAPLLMKTI